MFKNYIEIIRTYFSLVNFKDKYLMIFTLLDVTNVLLTLLIPYFISLIVQTITEGSYEYALLYVMLLCLTYIITKLGSFCTNWCYSSFFKKTYVDVHSKLVNSIYEYDEQYDKKISNGKIINSSNVDILNIAELPSFMIELTVEVIKLCVIYFIFAKENILIFLFVLAIDFIYYNYSKECNYKNAYYLSKQRIYADKMSGLLSQILIGLKDVKSLNFSLKLNNKMDGYYKKWQNNYFLKRKYQFTKKTFVNLIVLIGKVILYILLIYLLMKGKTTLSLFLLLISYYDKTHDSIREIMDFDLSIKEEAVSLYRIKDIIDPKENRLVVDGKLKKDDIEGFVEFKDVSFKYEKLPTLKNISFTAEANRVTCIVGKTGSGKTTIFNLLLRLYKVDAGNISLDGINIYDYSKEIYNSNISIVNQKTFLFNMSIRDNLSLVDSNKKRQMDACKRVGIHDFIISLPKGYNTVLKEDGINISGGQKQLLSLARALLTTAEIILLDEVTSALDPKTTKEIINLLKDLRIDHTIIIITHNKEVMKSSDKIIVLKEGQVDSIGSHEELLLNSKTYRDNYTRKSW